MKIDVRPDFDGSTYDPSKDKERLHRQLDVVLFCMLDSKWHTLAGIEQTTGFPQASISARLRDLRKEKFGAFPLKSRRKGIGKDGTWEYKIGE